MGAVTVSETLGASLPASSILTSVDVIGSEEVATQNVTNSWELLGMMPGIQLTETRMGAESGKPTFRAFNGEGYINGIKVMIDGIPSNVNSGNQRFIDMIFPLDIDYIEVVRGTNDPRYGLHNIGGNINIGTRQGGNYTDARLTYGSFATREVQMAIGRESGGFAQNYILARQDIHGERANSASRKYTLGGKWFLTSDSGDFRIGLITRLHHHEAEEPGFLTATELAADRDQSAEKNANDSDDRDMRHASLHMDWQINDLLAWNNRFYFNSYEDDRRITFTSYPIGNAPRQQRIWDERQYGWLSNMTWQANDYLMLDGGINLERQINTYERYRFNYALPTDFNAPAARTQNDERYTLDNIGVYLQAIIRPTERLKIIPAFRLDKFHGHTELNLTGQRAPLQDYNWIKQPKLSLVYSLTPAINVYANWGRTFQILTGSTSPAYITPGQAGYRPSINTGKEIGIRFEPTPGTQARIAAWQQDATDEVSNMPSTGTTVGLGETRRRGLDLQVATRLSPTWRVWFSHAIQEAKVKSAFLADGTSLAGKEVFSTPRHISNLGVEYKPAAKWTIGLQGRRQGAYYIDELNAQGKYGGFTLLDASVKYDFSDSISVDLQLKNLANREYVYAWYDNFFWGDASQPMFSPGAGRAAYLSLNLKM
ncbi:MAG: TonB-dependent receptor [Corticimicrobacter sp.]|uniref:TonB-dependent receptor n=1 Tax=Corticimicrobacter sp. TaxID=2678536 RepID=UPI0032D9B009